MLNRLKSRNIILNYVINYKNTDTTIEFNNYQLLQEDNYLSQFKVTVILEKTNLYNKIIELKKETQKGFTVSSYNLNFELFVETYGDIEVTESNVVKLELTCKGKAFKNEVRSNSLSGSITDTFFETPLKLVITSRASGNVEIRDLNTSRVYKLKNLTNGQMVTIDSYKKTVNLSPQNWDFWKFPITTNKNYRFQVVVGTADIYIMYKVRVL